MAAGIVYPTSSDPGDEVALRNAVRASNGLADETYRDVYAPISRDPKLQFEMDIFSIDVEGVPMPLVRNGSNRYFERSSRPAELLTKSLLQADYETDLFVVVPDVASLFNGARAAGWRADTAIKSIAGAIPRSVKDRFMFPGLFIDMPEDTRDMVRAYDSHVSPWAYSIILRALLRELGIDEPSRPVATLTSPYLPDIAARFSTVPSDTLLFSEQFLEREDNSAAANRGLQRWYSNPSAPVDARLLLIGDSHAYSALSQLLSCFFRRVEFIWTTRLFGINGDRKHLALRTKEVDIVIEESSERFFLNNYTRPL